jgi:hypothetical protein
VLLEGELVVAGEYVMPEMTFALLLFGSAFLASGREPGALALGASGLLLGVSATVRTAGLFAVPAWLAFVAWRHRRPVPVAVAVVTLALPLGAYLTWHHERTHVTGLTSADGWFLYGRVAEVADCSLFHVAKDARPLCRPLSPPFQRQAAHFGPSWYVFAPESPARRTFGPVGGRRSNRILRSFALSVIRSRPGEYARLVGHEFLRFFTSSRPHGRFSFPAEPAQGYAKDAPASSVGFVVSRRAKYLPGYRPRADAPAGALRAYDRLARIPPLGLGFLTLAALVALALPVPSRAAIALLTGMALPVLLGSVASSDYNARYMTPVMPLLLVAGGLAVQDLVALARLRTKRRSSGRITTP